MTEGLRKIELQCSDQINVSLAHYPAGGRQRPHAHSYTQISFLLSGGLLERHGSREWTPVCSAVGRKPAGVQHDNHWGADGALIFSIKLRGGELEMLEASKPVGWTPSGMTAMNPVLVRHCLSEDAALRLEAVEDLLAICGPAGPPPHSPPKWLAGAIEEIRDSPSSMTVAEAARLAGVHRAHFSMIFTRHFNVPPSVYRRGVMVARAVSRLARDDDSITTIAHEEGFSDQAHLSRCIRAASGVPPRMIRKWLTAPDMRSS